MIEMINDYDIAALLRFGYIPRIPKNMAGVDWLKTIETLSDRIHEPRTEAELVDEGDIKNEFTIAGTL